MLTSATGNIAVNAQTIAETRSQASGPQIVNVAAAKGSESALTVSAVTAPSLDQVKQAVESINQSMKSLTQGLEFSIDQESDRVIVKVIVPETKEVIRQIPSEETLAIAKSLDHLIGKLVREVA